MDVGAGIVSAAFVLMIWLLAGTVALAFFAFWIWMLVDCLMREFHDSTTKLVWALVIIFVHWIGALIYFFLGRPQGTLPGQQHPTA